MAKTLRVRSRAGWVTKPVADTEANKLTAEEVDDNFLAMEAAVDVIGTSQTAVSSTMYVVTASLTLTLPLSPAVGDWVKVSNLSETTTGTIARNGENIMGLAEDMLLDVENAGITLTYTGATQGWVIT